ncbi:MAG: hypothetical protein K2N38_02985 [Oscillospiraceae bacterium]|nr:hypothetical protein [Oscillospiraceae bacterium]
MFTEKVKNAAEKVMPVEKRFIEKLESFFAEKPRRLIVSGVAAVLLLFLLFVITERVDFFSVPNAVLGLAELMAVGAFFANINEFSLKKFAAAVSVAAVILYLALMTYGVLVGVNLSQIDSAIAMWTGHVILAIPVCATAITLTVLFVYFTVCRKKRS